MSIRSRAMVCLLALSLMGGGCDSGTSEGGDTEEVATTSGAAGADAQGDGGAGSSAADTTFKAKGAFTDRDAGAGMEQGADAEMPQASGGSVETSETSVPEKPGVTPELGATDFRSADLSSGSGRRGTATVAQNAGAAGTMAGAPLLSESALADDSSDDADGSAVPSSGSAVVERGDIFQALPDGRILNLNMYRGLQVIDVRDPELPVVEGRLPLPGSPVELYVIEDLAIVLLNDWSGYTATGKGARIERYEGGLIAVIDISDPTAPRLVDEQRVAGSLFTSRLTRQGEQAALFAAVRVDNAFFAPTPVSGVVEVTTAERPSTKVLSFDVSTGELEPRDELAFTGYIQDIQATPQVMMVARQRGGFQDEEGVVSLVDISSPSGEMVLGDEVETAGIVENKFNMDIYGNVLRVASGSGWFGLGNHIQTYDITDLSNVRELDHCTFGEGQQLYATLFIDNRAFIVTYLRQDPFHAFAIGDDGSCQERNEFVVSGWNDFFRAVSGETRLIGIGKNDEGRSNTLAVSLYDITNLDNASPLLERAEVELAFSSSEASWDDRAFSVLEDAVAVPAADGTVETGLVLLPFQGYDGRESSRGVQIFSFSDDTLTRRGVMEGGSIVRRSFLVTDDLASNLSNFDMSLYDVQDPDAPALLGDVVLAPNYSEVYRFGEHVLRVRRPFPGFEGEGITQLQVLAPGADLDAASPVATLEAPAEAIFFQVGDLLVGSAMVENNAPSMRYTVYDFSEPTSPRLRGSVENNLAAGPTPPTAGCSDCERLPFMFDPREAYATSSALVFTTHEYRREYLDTQLVCNEYFESRCDWFAPPALSEPDPGNEPGADEISISDDIDMSSMDAVTDADTQRVAEDGGLCTSYYSGYKECILNEQGEEQSCESNFQRCDLDTGACEPIDEDELPYPTNRNCYPQEKYRNWFAYTFHVLNLQDPDAPTFEASIEMPRDEAGVSVALTGDTLYVNSQDSIEVDDASRGYIKRYFQTIDLSEPGAAMLGARINVPGEVILVDGDEILTRDMVWDDEGAVSLLARLRVDGDLARLLAQRLFEDREVQAVQVDAAGQVLVSHGPASWLQPVIGPFWDKPSAAEDAASEVYRLSILNDGDLSLLGETDLDRWASLRAVWPGRALFGVPGAHLLFNTEDPSMMFAQAFFPTRGFYGSPSFLVDESSFALAAGYYGVYQLDLDESNLLAP